MPTYTLDSLAELDPATLDRIFAGGTCPEPTALAGVMDGRVLDGALARPPLRGLRVWRGKAFTHDGGAVSGLNRIGLGPLSTRRYRFTARVQGSAFADRDVVLLDHDQPSNPSWVRRFHDEVVEVDDGVYLATSHHRTDGGLRFLCHFALAR